MRPKWIQNIYGKILGKLLVEYKIIKIGLCDTLSRGYCDHIINISNNKNEDFAIFKTL